MRMETQLRSVMTTSMWNFIRLEQIGVAIWIVLVACVGGQVRGLAMWRPWRSAAWQRSVSALAMTVASTVRAAAR